MSGEGSAPLNTRVTRARRRGFGTTATFVLVILGIALFILVIQDLMRQGTSISIGRAYAAAHVLRVGRMSLDEAFESKKGRETLQKTLVKGLAQASSQLPGVGPLNDSTPVERDKLVRAFLDAIWHAPGSDGIKKLDDVFRDLADDRRRTELLLAPGKPGGNLPVKGAFWVRGGKAANPLNGNVEFDSDPAYTSNYRAETVDVAYKREIDNGVLKVEDVQMRVIAFRHQKARGGNPPGPGPDEVWGSGLVRAQVKLRWILPREIEGRPIAINRTMVEDHKFYLESPAASQSGQPQQDWKLSVVDSEWQRGTSES